MNLEKYRSKFSKANRSSEKRNGPTGKRTGTGSFCRVSPVCHSTLMGPRVGFVSSSRVCICLQILHLKARNEVRELQAMVSSILEQCNVVVLLLFFCVLFFFQIMYWNKVDSVEKERLMYREWQFMKASSILFMVSSLISNMTTS